MGLMLLISRIIPLWQSIAKTLSREVLSQSLPSAEI